MRSADAPSARLPAAAEAANQSLSRPRSIRPVANVPLGCRYLTQELPPRHPQTCPRLSTPTELCRYWREVEQHKIISLTPPEGFQNTYLRLPRSTPPVTLFCAYSPTTSIPSIPNKFGKLRLFLPLPSVVCNIFTVPTFFFSSMVHVGKGPSTEEHAENESEDAKELENMTDSLENDVEEDEDAPSSGDVESEPEEDGEGHAVEDKFFKIKEMERFLDDAEAPQDLASPLHLDSDASESPEELEEGDNGEDEENNEGNDYNMQDKERAIASRNTDLKYGAFFGASKRKKRDGIGGTDKSVQSPASFAQLETVSTYGRQLAKVQKRITELENANLNQKLWTMQGEVSASKRPKNSALEVELDFEHNVPPPPVITEEITASLEDMIRNRISKNNFDDVQRKPSLPVLPPKEQTEIDENKSKKGLAELYEADYMQKTGLTLVSSAPADELRKEATRLFKSLCIKLDALSHFHFTPKPVVEDMVVRSDVPALAMEEVAPLMVSDAQMLAPEEHFTAEGVVKADAELTHEERKRRRARKKEKGKALKRKELSKESGISILQSRNSEKPLLPQKRKIEQSNYSKSKKVFEQLDESNKNGKKNSVDSQNLRASFLKL